MLTYPDVGKVFAARIWNWMVLGMVYRHPFPHTGVLVEAFTIATGERFDLLRITCNSSVKQGC